MSVGLPHEFEVIAPAKDINSPGLRNTLETADQAFQDTNSFVSALLLATRRFSGVNSPASTGSQIGYIVLGSHSEVSWGTDISATVQVIATTAVTTGPGGVWDLRVGISLDGGGSYTYGQAEGASTGGLHRTTITALHHRAGTPSGTIRMRMEASQTGGANGDGVYNPNSFIYRITAT